MTSSDQGDTGPPGPDPDDDDDNALLAGLVDRAAGRNRERASELTRWCDALERDRRLEPADLDRIRAVTHALVGSAGTFGHPEVSRLAGRLSSWYGGVDATSVSVEDRVRELRALLRRIDELLARAEPSGAPRADPVHRDDGAGSALG